MLVRTDLPPSQQIVQACHACLEASKQYPWCGEHPHLALLAVPNEQSLRSWLERASACGLQTTEFIEPDLNNSLTAFVVSNVSHEQRRIFSNLPILKTKHSPINKGANMATLSKWGYHPCTREVYLKLKELNKLAQKSLYRIAEHKRWFAKHPQNRRRFIGSVASGSACRKQDLPKACRIYEPIPEPILPPVDIDTINTIAADYKNARTPVVLSQVKSITMSEITIDDLLATLQAFYTRSTSKVSV